MTAKFDDYYILRESKIITALKKMDSQRVKLLIVGKKNDFQGLISIGDIQRSIIKGIELDVPISKILRKDLIVANEQDNEEDIKSRMLTIRAEYMPVVNAKNEVVKIIFWDELLKNEPLPPKKIVNIPVIIMAGGKGTRLKPITNFLPKPLIPIGEKPIVEHIINRFVNIGCHDFFFSVNFKADLIKYYFDSFEHPNYRINYFEESKPLGTAGSLHLLDSKINSTFFVSNCDILIDQDYSEIYEYHKTNRNELTLVSVLKHIKIPYGTLTTLENGLLDAMSEKPELTYKINAGLYLLEPHLLMEIPKNQFFHITELIEKVKKRNGKVGVFPISEKSWKDIGVWDEFLKNSKDETI